MAIIYGRVRLELVYRSHIKFGQRRNLKCRASNVPLVKACELALDQPASPSQTKVNQNRVLRSTFPPGVVRSHDLRPRPHDFQMPLEIQMTEILQISI